MPSYQVQNALRSGNLDAARMYGMGVNANAYNMRKWEDQLSLMEKEMDIFEQKWNAEQQQQDISNLTNLLNAGWNVGTPTGRPLTDTEKKLSDLYGYGVYGPDTPESLPRSAQLLLAGAGAYQNNPLAWRYGGYGTTSGTTSDTTSGTTKVPGSRSLGRNVLTGADATEAAQKRLRDLGYTYGNRYGY